METLIHLKDQNGKSFSVTPHAFENVIKKDKNWRRKYDLVGKVDGEAHAVKSDSAKPYTPVSRTPVKEVVKATPQVTDKVEETKEEIFNSNSTEGNGEEFHKLEENQDEKQTQKQTTGNGNKKRSGNKGK